MAYCFMTLTSSYFSCRDRRSSAACRTPRHVQLDAAIEAVPQHKARRLPFNMRPRTSMQSASSPAASSTVMILSLTEAFTYPSIPNNAAKPMHPARKIKTKTLPIPVFFRKTITLVPCCPRLLFLPAALSCFIAYRKYRQYFRHAASVKCSLCSSKKALSIAKAH